MCEWLARLRRCGRRGRLGRRTRVVAHAAAGDRKPAAGVRGDQTRISDHIEAPRGDQGAQAKEKLSRLEAQDVATVAVLALHLVEDRPVVGA